MIFHCQIIHESIIRRKHSWRTLRVLNLPNKQAVSVSVIDTEHIKYHRLCSTVLILEEPITDLPSVPVVLLITVIA